MKNSVITLKEKEISLLKETYSKYLKTSLNPYVLFTIEKDNSLLTIYKSGKVVFNNDKMVNEVTSLFHNSFESGIGSDEVGTGDVFGPIVVCACYIDKKNYDFVKRLNTTDSKALDDERICEIAKELISKLTYSLLVLDNRKFNQLTEKGFNLNKIKAILHNQAILNCMKKVGRKVYVCQDQFCEPSLYFRYLENEEKIYREIDFHTKGETYYLGVAAASIIARYAFLQKWESIEEYVGYKIPKGAGVKVDSIISKMRDEHTEDYFYDIAKINYKNFVKVPRKSLGGYDE